MLNAPLNVIKPSFKYFQKLPNLFNEKQNHSEEIVGQISSKKLHILNVFGSTNVIPNLMLSYSFINNRSASSSSPSILARCYREFKLWN